MSNSGSMRFPASRNVRENRKSSCCIRPSNTVLGAIKGIETVPFGPADKLRLSEGKTWALVNVAVAEYAMPGRFWYVVATWKSYGRGNAPENFTCVDADQGGTTSQYSFVCGVLGRAALIANCKLSCARPQLSFSVRPVFTPPLILMRRERRMLRTASTP